MDVFTPNKHVQLVKDVEMRMSERKSPNRLCDISDWKIGNELTDIMNQLAEGTYIHRKSWEYAMCISGLNKFSVVTPEARAISIGAGYERPLFFFANKIKEVVATDIYDDSHAEGNARMLTNPEEFAFFEYRKDHLTVRQMRGTNLEYSENTFDFAFTLSSIEHFGSRENSKKAMQEMFRVLKQGGVACVATEFILNNATHEEFFAFEDLEKFIIKSAPFDLVGGDLDLRISQSLFYNPIDMDQEKNFRISPHIVLKTRDVIFTSIILFFRKPS